MNRARLYQQNGGSLMKQNHTPLMGDDPLDGLVGRHSQTMACAGCTSQSIWTQQWMRMLLEMGKETILNGDDEEEKLKKAKKRLRRKPKRTRTKSR